jgi:hypothetical protein
LTKEAWHIGHRIGKITSDLSPLKTLTSADVTVEKVEWSS